MRNATSEHIQAGREALSTREIRHVILPHNGASPLREG